MWCNKTVKLCLIQCLHIIFRVFLGKLSYNHHCCQYSPNPVLNLLIICIWYLGFNFGVAVLALKRYNIQPNGLCIRAHITVLTHGKQRLMCCCVCQSQYFQSQTILSAIFSIKLLSVSAIWISCPMKFSRADTHVKMWWLSDVQGNNYVPIFRVWQNHQNTLQMGMELVTETSWKPSHLDTAVCPWKFHWILLRQRIQDFSYLCPHLFLWE
jgi:hypothetical protein